MNQKKAKSLRRTKKQESAESAPTRLRIDNIYAMMRLPLIYRGIHSYTQTCRSESHFISCITDLITRVAGDISEIEVSLEKNKDGTISIKLTPKAVK